MSQPISEIGRRADVVDMMISIHAKLRDTYARRARWLDLLIFGVSVVLCATVFLDPKLAAHTPLGEEGVRVVLGVATLVIFFLSIVGLLVDWKAAIGRHSRAVEELAELKSKSRLLGDASPDSPAVAEYFRLYDFTMGTIAPIPDEKFVSLKAYHVSKVILSREVSQHPNTPVFLLRLRLRWRGVKALLRSEENGNSD